MLPVMVVVEKPSVLHTYRVRHRGEAGLSRIARAVADACRGLYRSALTASGLSEGSEHPRGSRFGLLNADAEPRVHHVQARSCRRGR